MRVILVDDEQPGIDELTYQLSKYPDLNIIGAYSNPLEVLEHLTDLRPDALFLDIDMPYMDGMQLAVQIQSLQAGIMIVFVTAYSQYALESFKAFPLDYLLKPVKEARLDATVEHMRRQYELLNARRESQSSLYITCFGSFEVVRSGKSAEIKWGTRRVKELFLYLLDRCGAPPTRSELVHALFGGVDDKKTANNIYVTVYKLRNILDILDPSRKFIRLREDYSLETAPGICDYIDFMYFARQNTAITAKNALAAARVLNSCTGPYHANLHSQWAVDTAAVIENEYERIALGLAGFHSSAGRFREAENVITNLLIRNPFCEDAHTSLLEIYIHEKKYDAFKASYLEYERILKKEFQEIPATKYTNFFNTLKNA